MNNKYPDSEPDTLGDINVKKLMRLPGAKNAPMIRWGDEFNKWPIEQREKYLRKLASSINNALDIMQKERNAWIIKYENVERQLEQTVQSYAGLGQQMHKELGSADAEKQELYKDIVAKTQEITKLKKHVKALQARVKELETA